MCATAELVSAGPCEEMLTQEGHEGSQEMERLRQRALGPTRSQTPRACSGGRELVLPGGSLALAQKQACVPVVLLAPPIPPPRRGS